MSPLSKTGQNRREEILRGALREARRRRRKRMAVKGGVLCAILIPVMALLLRVHAPDMVGRPSIAVKQLKQHEAAPEKRIAVSRIMTDPDIVRRLSLPAEPSHVQVIHDEQLLSELAAAHEPAGLAYVNGKATLMYR